MPVFVSYIRVSTAKQGESGLGLEAQQEAVRRHVGDNVILEQFVEVESGKSDSNRPKLTAALDLCKRKKAVLVIAKLDRLSRNVAFIANLIDSGVQFVCCDMPHANELTLHIMSAMAQHERKAISARTKDALAAAKARGTKLGNQRWQESIARAREAKQLQPPAPAVVEMMRQLRSEGKSLRKIATKLNELGLRTPNKGSLWHPQTVSNALAAAPDVWAVAA